jgi:hypothetical protein
VQELDDVVDGLLRSVVSHDYKHGLFSSLAG